MTKQIGNTRISEKPWHPGGASAHGPSARHAVFVEYLKKPFGTAKMVRIKGVRYLALEDAFDVEFDDELSFLEPHATIRKANKISPKAQPVEVLLDDECHLGFEVRYDNGQVAEVSWSSIRELPPKH